MQCISFHMESDFAHVLAYSFILSSDCVSYPLIFYLFLGLLFLFNSDALFFPFAILEAQIILHVNLVVR